MNPALIFLAIVLPAVMVDATMSLRRLVLIATAIEKHLSRR